MDFNNQLNQNSVNSNDSNNQLNQNGVTPNDSDNQLNQNSVNSNDSNNQLNQNSVNSNDSGNQLNQNNVAPNGPNNQLNPNNFVPNVVKSSPLSIVGIVVGIFVLVMGIIFIGSKFFGDKNIEEPNNDEIINNEEPVENESDTCLGNKVAVTGLKGENLDYYYNIDTSKFDKTKFDGNINFFGYTINGKITSNKLKNAGITFTCGYFEKTELETPINPELDYGYSSCEPNFSFNIDSDITNPAAGGMVSPFETIIIRDFTKSKELYSDTGIVLVQGQESFNWNLTARDIYPKQLGVDSYKDINIDLVLEKLGNPTYVYNRTSPCLKDKYNSTVYIYVYDDVSFLFAFSNYANLTLAGLRYLPYEYFNDEIQGLIDNEKVYESNK